MSWTSNLEQVRLGNMKQITACNPKADVMVSSSCSLAPVCDFENDTRLMPYVILSYIHDLYMLPACTSYSDIGAGGKSFQDVRQCSYIMSTLQFSKQSGTLDGKRDYTFPLLLTDTHEIRAETAEGRQVKVMTNGVRGLQCEMGLIVTGNTPKEVSATLRHETMHAIISMFPELRQSMYGDNEVMQMEEIATHVATDFFDVMKSISSLEIEMEDIEVPLKGDQWTFQTSYEYFSYDKNDRDAITLKKNSAVLILHHIKDVKMNGVSLILDKLDVDTSKDDGNIYAKLSKFKEILEDELW